MAYYATTVAYTSKFVPSKIFPTEIEAIRFDFNISIGTIHHATSGDIAAAIVTRVGDLHDKLAWLHNYRDDLLAQKIVTDFSKPEIEPVD